MPATDLRRRATPPSPGSRCGCRHRSRPCRAGRGGRSRGPRTRPAGGPGGRADGVEQPRRSPRTSSGPPYPTSSLGKRPKCGGDPASYDAAVGRSDALASPAPFARSSRLERRLRRVLILWAVVGLLLGAETFVLHVTTDPLADVHAYYDAGARLNAGLPLYDQPATTDDADFYRYPPLLAIAFRPLALLPFGTAAAIWEVAVVASLAGTLVVLGTRRETTWIVAAILALPIVWSVVIGQAQVPVTLLLAIASPWAVALAANVKLFPALAALYWLGRRDTRALLQFGIATGVLVLVQLVLEPRATIDFVQQLRLSQVGNVANISGYAFSPVLWGVLVVVGVGTAIRVAPSRYGWAAAVAMSVLASPRLLTSQLMTLLAAVRQDEEG